MATNPTITRADQWRTVIALTFVGIVCALAEVLVFHTPPVHAVTVIGGIALFASWLILTEE